MAKHRARPFSAKGPIKTLRLVVLAYLSIHASLISAQDKPIAVALIRTHSPSEQSRPKSPQSVWANSWSMPAASRITNAALDDL